MTTIQLPPALDTATAIPAFSTSTKEAFEDFLKANSSRYQITREKRANIISWIRDNLEAPKTQHDYSQQHHALQSFRYDVEKDMLLALPSESWPKNH